jgi:hypothetical protein
MAVAKTIFFHAGFLFKSRHGRRIAAAHSRDALPRRHALAQSKEFSYFSRMETTVKLNDELFAEAKHFAKLSHRSLSEVVAEALHEKLSKSNGKTPPKQNVSNFISELHPDIRRLTGIAPADLDAETVYHEHFARRHK